MKIIDLLNKIANGEIYTGTHVIYRDKEYIFTGSCLENIKEKYAIAMFGLDNLNNEVEIIEEDKKDKFTGWKMYQDGKEVYSFGNDGTVRIRDDVITNIDSLKEPINLNSDYYIEEGYYENISKEELVLDIQSLKKYLNKVIDRLIVIDEGDN